MTPQAGASGSFAGQDNRLNNMTVDGSYFNNSFGLGSAPGERTNVAPISLESIEQVQVSVAPFDVRQGSFIGAAVNTVTRSGTNQLTASFYHRMRNEDFVGTEARGQAVNPGTFNFRDTGVWGGGPIVKNRLFVFGNYENEEDNRPLTTYRANTGGEPVAGTVTRVLESDLTALSSFLQQNFGYDPGAFAGLTDLTPAKRYLLRTDLNLTTNNKISFRYNQLDSSSDNYTSGSSSAGIGRSPFTTAFLGFGSTTYSILENIKSGIGEWNSVIGSSMSNSLITGYTTNDESRRPLGDLFPFVDILQDEYGLRLVRVRAVHCSERAEISHVSAAGQLHEVHLASHADVWRLDAEIPRRTTCSGAAARRAITPSTRWPTSTPKPALLPRTRIGRRASRERCAASRCGTSNVAEPR